LGWGAKFRFALSSLEAIRVDFTKRIFETVVQFATFKL
jgi:hypothetical protein